MLYRNQNNSVGILALYCLSLSSESNWGSFNVLSSVALMRQPGKCDTVD